MKHLLHPEADEEFADAVRYYSEISPELGVRFYREMERLLHEACEQPERFWLSSRNFLRTFATVDEKENGHAHGEAVGDLFQN